MQTKHNAYGHDADADAEADMGETQSFQAQRNLKEDIDCDEEDKIAQKISQIQSQSQRKSQVQLKSQGAQLKSHTGQLKTVSQVKSQIKIKTQAAPLKSYQAPVSLQGSLLQQIKSKAYDLDKDLTQEHQLHKKVHSYKRKHRRFRQITDSLPQQPQTHDGYIVQLQGQLQGRVYDTESSHQAQEMCYCPKRRVNPILSYLHRIIHSLMNQGPGHI